jgi:hypothetical protein
MPEEGELHTHHIENLKPHMDIKAYNLLRYPYSVPNIETVAVSCIYGMNSQMALTVICLNVIRDEIAQRSDWLDSCSSFPGWDKRYSSISWHPDQFSGQPIILPKRYCRLFPEG